MKRNLQKRKELMAGRVWRQPMIALALAAMVMFTGMPMMAHAASTNESPLEQDVVTEEMEVQAMDVPQMSAEELNGEDAAAAENDGTQMRGAGSIAWEIPITSVSFPKNVTLKVGESKTLKVDVSPTGTTYKTNIEWGYQTNGVFTNRVNGCGTYWNQSSSETLTGVKVGRGYLNTTVKVYDSNKKYTTSFKISTVVDVVASSSGGQPVTGQNKDGEIVSWVVSPGSTSRPLQKIALNKTSMTLKEGQSQTLTVSYTPSNTTDSKNVSWSTGNSKIATVSSGKVTAKASGTTTITAKVGSKTATCKVVVQRADGYRDASGAYTQLNNFRTKKGVWQWNSNNKSKTYFNTNSKNKLKALKKDAALEKTAKIRAKELSVKGSHTRPNGKSCFTAYPSKFGWMGENIASYYETSSAVTTAWAEENEKYSGQGHRRNMLNKNFTHVGIACYEKDGVKYWVQCFGGK